MTTIQQSNRIEKIILTYLDVKSVVIDSGYSNEIDWQEGTRVTDLNETILLRESAWVILSSGMKEAVVRKKFNEISNIYFQWKSALKMVRNQATCERKALEMFNNKPKISAIQSVANRIARSGFKQICKRIQDEGIQYLLTFDYIGPTTVYHLAKNIGLEVVKPDRHLMRITSALGFESPKALCALISMVTGDRISVVDVVLWRYATINRRYLEIFSAV